MPPHAPHDDVYDIAVSPDFAEEPVLFVVCRDMFLKSTDGGLTWTNVVTGLNNMASFFTDKVQRFSLAVSQREKHILYFASRGDGLYRSTDEGASWSRVDTGTHRDIRTVAVSPHATDFVVAALAPGGLLVSDDGAETWRLAADISAPITAIVFAPDRADVLAVGDTAGNVHLSRDGGAQWYTTRLPGDVGEVTSVAVSAGSNSDGAIAVGTSRGGPLLSTDDGGSFAPVPEPPDDRFVTSVLFSPGFLDNGTLWISTFSEGVFISEDRGLSWTQRGDGLTRSPQKNDESFHDRPHFGHLRSAGTGDETPDEQPLILAGFDGLFHSTDGGVTWYELETLPSTLVVSLDVSPDFANDSSVAVSTYINGAFLSEDAGDSWVPIDNGLEQKSFWRRSTDYIARLFAVRFSPHHAVDRRMFCAHWTRFLVSEDRGANWHHVELHEPPIRNQRLVFAASPNFAEDHKIFLGNRYGELYVSTDGGMSVDLHAKVGAQIGALVAAPDFTGSSGTLFAATRGRGGHRIRVSTDQGVTWESLDDGLGHVTHLVVSPAFADDGTLFAGTRHGLFKSEDRGRSWTGPNRGAPGIERYIEAVALSPAFADDGTVLLSVSGLGLFKSVDRAETFVPVGEELLAANHVFANMPNPVANPIVFSPDYARDQTIFGYSPTNVFRSTDGGEHWTDITQPRTLHQLTAHKPLSNIHFLTRPVEGAANAVNAANPAAYGTESPEKSRPSPKKSRARTARAKKATARPLPADPARAERAEAKRAASAERARPPRRAGVEPAAVAAGVSTESASDGRPAKKAAAKKTAAKKAAAKKTAPKKTAPKKTAAKRTAAKRTAAKKTDARPLKGTGAPPAPVVPKPTPPPPSLLRRILSPRRWVRRIRRMLGQ